ncbi:DUF805 domain-containing protein [Novosphingobium cyanobacteriorum]|uniref:DUF805 domain-containing protein n=1 Tax=Novosphingobium cyanobacteriorum TaxID=3024215 RepID=A0ABT6CEM6_9SPHN|nr:DUF805 domain-containing protein [Novosphingobium cyanobacteriorum]MDF8332366.1 DUF805 domain-containing protein [Novosphingobium cyanobacteriorum]
MEWMLMPYRRYADFSGRSRRKEYWMFALLSMIVAFVSVMLMFAGGMGSDGTAPGGTFWLGTLLIVVWGLGSIVPSIAVQVRRFHDQGRSGWMVLLGFIPYVGGIIVLVFMCLEGTRGPNQYGPDPKNPAQSDVFA